MPFQVKKSNSSQKKRKQKISSYSAYVTYKSPLAASTAIVALSLPSKRLIKSKTNTPNFFKASFGTNKFCLYFIDGVACRNRKCNFVHNNVYFEDCFIKSRDVDNKKIFQSQISWAKKCVADWIHMNQLTEKIKICENLNFEKSKAEFFSNGLPSIDQVFSFIVTQMRKDGIQNAQSALESINSFEIGDGRETRNQEINSVGNFIPLKKEEKNENFMNRNVLKKNFMKKKKYSTLKKITSLEANLDNSLRNQTPRQLFSTSLNFPTRTVFQPQAEERRREGFEQEDMELNNEDPRRKRYPVNLSFTTQSTPIALNLVLKGLNDSEMTYQKVTLFSSNIEFNHDPENLMLNLPEGREVWHGNEAKYRRSESISKNTYLRLESNLARSRGMKEYTYF